MENEISKVYFSQESYQQNEHLKLLKFLMDYAYGKSKDYFDIHIYPADCGAFIIEWTQIPWDGSFGSRFICLNEEEQEEYKYQKTLDNEDET